MLRHLYALAFLAIASSSFGVTPNERSVPPDIRHVHSTIFRVPGNFTTIQAALDVAADGDTVLVGPGTYVESLDFDEKNIALHSVDGPDSTIIQGSGAYEKPVVEIGPLGELVGFTIRDGRASFGAGISVREEGTLIAHNIFESNTQRSGGYGAAIGGNRSSPIIDGNWFVNNTCDDQGLSGVVAFVNRSSPIIINNVFINNPCRAINMTTPRGTTPIVMNNTIVSNEVGIRVDARISTNLHAYRNNIIVGNDVGFHMEYGDDSNAPIWENNLVFDNTTNYEGISDPTGQNGNIAVDPLFEDAANENYRLLAGSPAIDAGTATNAPLNDFDGKERPVDGNADGVLEFDIGAYEFRVMVIQAHFDVQPASCPNSLGTKKRGAIPTAILGSDDFDVEEVDVSTVELQGVGPVRSVIDDVGRPADGTPCNCTDEGPDGYPDLELKFDAPAVLNSLFPLVKGEQRELTLIGNLLDGTPFEAVDCVILRGNTTTLPQPTEASARTAPQATLFISGNGYVQRAHYVLPKADHVTLDVFDVRGRRVKRFVRGVQSVGSHTVEWQVEDIASGVYFYRLTVGSTQLTRKSILIR